MVVAERTCMQRSLPVAGQGSVALQNVMTREMGIQDQEGAFEYMYWSSVGLEYCMSSGCHLYGRNSCDSPFGSFVAVR